MPDSRVQLIGSSLWNEVLEAARQSPRRRMNHNFHRGLDENPNRFLNAMLERTYITPHRHLDPPKPESFLVLEGRAAMITFEDGGSVLETHVLGGETIGIEIDAGVWHTLVVLTPHAVCYEVKPGPYSPADDKSFAPWAPREGANGCGAYLDMLLTHVRARG